MEELARDLRASERVVILTGAGISVASGIAPFRKSADALWERNVTELATRRFFQQSPKESWLWYLKRFDNLLDKQPNPAHHAIAELQEWGVREGKEVTLITQNIDLLHRKAGSSSPIEIHGRSDMTRCVQEGQCEYASPRGLIPSAELDLERLVQSEDEADLPRCPGCGSLVRPHILWFDEFYTEHEEYRFKDALEALSDADLLICSGTSFSVGITAIALDEAARQGAKIWGIDPSPDRDLIDELSWITEVSEEAFPHIARLLI